MLQTIKNQANLKILTENIFIAKIEIILINFLDFCSNLSCSFFCSFVNKKFNIIIDKRKF